MYTKKDFDLKLSEFAHELRNPLAAATSSTQLLESKYPELLQEKIFQSLEQDLKFMADLLIDFCSFTLRNEIQAKTFMFDELIKEVVLSFASLIADKDIEFTSKIELQDYPFFGDPVQLQQVFRNLLKNASEAVDPGDRIFLHCYEDGNNIIVTVEDTGCGITEEQLANIFKPYYTYCRHRSSGLGLSVSQEIVKTHHGIIEVSSVFGEGSMFRVTLPAKNQSYEKPTE